MDSLSSRSSTAVCPLGQGTGKVLSSHVSSSRIRKHSGLKFPMDSYSFALFGQAGASNERDFVLKHVRSESLEEAAEKFV